MLNIFQEKLRVFILHRYVLIVLCVHKTIACAKYSCKYFWLVLHIYRCYSFNVHIWDLSLFLIKLH